MTEETCPFCGRHPFEYVDIGVGYQPVAVTCCELGVQLYQHGDEELSEVAGKICDLQAEVERLQAALDTALKGEQESEANLAHALHQLAAARDDALEDAAKVCDCRDREKDDSMYLVGCIDASQGNAKRIRTMKAKP